MNSVQVVMEISGCSSGTQTQPPAGVTLSECLRFHYADEVLLRRPLVDRARVAVPGFSKGDCKPVEGDYHDAPVEWTVWAPYAVDRNAIPIFASTRLLIWDREKGVNTEGTPRSEVGNVSWLCWRSSTKLE
jgi:hypothetical protein